MLVYKGFLNEQHKALIRGTIGDKAEIYHRIEDKAKLLIDSVENQLLLSLPSGRIALPQS
jgi:hypothetical protein